MKATTVRVCGSCATASAGVGGVLCDTCRERIGNVFDHYWELYEPGTGRDTGRVVARTSPPDGQLVGSGVPVVGP